MKVMTIFAPNYDLALLVLRLALGIVFLAHGPIKFVKTKELAKQLGLHEISVRAIGTLEVVGAILILLGLASQIGAALLVIVMMGAIYFKSAKWEKGFTGEGGWELEFILLAAALAIVLSGAGDYRLF